MKPPPGNVREVALLFLKLGLTAFGGPAAHIAMMEDEVVRRRGWMSREEFVDLMSAVNLIPGPNSTEMAIHVGRLRAGTPGLLTAGACFILPAAAMTGALAWAYVRYGSAPAFPAILKGIQPVVLAIVLVAISRLSAAAVKTRALAAVAAGVFALSLLRAHELVLLGAGGVLGMLLVLRNRKTGTPKVVGAAGLLAAAGLSPSKALSAAALSTALAPFSLPALFLAFLKIGSVLFGSGYVLLAFLENDLVVRRGWLTRTQLLDAVAAGQFTPGPVFTTATFVGYLLGRGPGAVLATLGIFLPAFVFVGATAPLVARLRASRPLGGFLDGLNAASLGLMGAVTVTLTGTAVTGAATAILAVAALAALLATRLNSVWLVVAGGVAGALLFR
jgi:chromate transporter